MFKKKNPPQDIQCLNCETHFSGWFCPECGQKAETKRLTIVQVISDFMDALSDSDKGFLRTVIDLSQNPGDMLNNYLAGKRRRYLSAGKYTFFLVILFTLNISVLEKHFGLFKVAGQKLQELSFQIEDSSEESDSTPSGEKAIGISTTPESKNVNINFALFGVDINRKVSKKQFFNFIRDLIPIYQGQLFSFLKYFLAAWIPIFSFFTFLFFRKAKLNMAEHLAINSYIYSHLLLISLLISGLYWIFPHMLATTAKATIVACGFYLFYCYMQLFGQGRYQILRVSTVIFAGSTAYISTLFTMVLLQMAYVFVINIDQL